MAALALTGAVKAQEASLLSHPCRLPAASDTGGQVTQHSAIAKVSTLSKPGATIVPWGFVPVLVLKVNLLACVSER